MCYTFIGIHVASEDNSETTGDWNSGKNKNCAFSKFSNHNLQCCNNVFYRLFQGPHAKIRRSKDNY